jgi:AmiR/NasT family two-component response regulator
MKQRRLEEEVVNAAMRKTAMNRNLKILEPARRVAAASEFLAPAGDVFL